MSSLPDGFTIRPATWEDLDAAVDLTNARARADIGEGDMTVARLRMFWSEPDRNLETDNWVIEGPDGLVVAYADISSYDDGQALEFDYAVLPELTWIGLEQAILEAVLDRAEQAARSVPSDVRVVLETSVWASNAADQALLTSYGFVPTRVWNRMLIDMQQLPPEPTWPAGISVRTFNIDETDLVHEAWEDAQQDEYGFSSLTPEEFRRYLVEEEANFDPTLWFLAIDESNGRIAGYALGRWERPGEPDTGQIRYLAVRREYRRRGIAEALLLHAFREFHQRGKRRVGLAVDSTSLTGADRLYARAGMHAAHQSIIYTRTIRDTTDQH